MKKSGWLALASLVGVSLVPAQAAAQDVDAPLSANRELRAQIDYGRGSQNGSAFRISVSGGASGGVALLSVQPALEGGPTDTALGADRAGARSFFEWLRLDEYGSGALTVRELRMDEAWRVQAHARRGGESLHSNVLWTPAGGPQQTLEIQRGDIVISEIMKDPTAVSDSQGEWFELVNIATRTINIEGWTISDDGSNAHEIANNKNLVLLAPGQRIVLGNNADPATNGGVHVDYEYSGFSLSNGADEILLTARNGKLVDVVRYDDGVLWPDEPGKSLNLDPNYEDAWRNDFYLRWCSAVTPMGSGPDSGTPGQPNDLCP